MYVNLWRGRLRTNYAMLEWNEKWNGFNCPPSAKEEATALALWCAAVLEHIRLLRFRGFFVVHSCSVSQCTFYGHVVIMTQLLLLHTISGLRWLLYTCLIRSRKIDSANWIKSELAATRVRRRFREFSSVVKKKWRNNVEVVIDCKCEQSFN